MTANSTVVAAISPDHPGGDSFEEAVQHPVLDHLPQAVMQEQREAEGRQEDADSHRDRAERAAPEVANEGRENNKGSEEDAGERKPVQERRVGHPAVAYRIGMRKLW